MGYSAQEQGVFNEDGVIPKGMFVGLYIGDVICIKDENPRSKFVNETPEHLSPADVQLDAENRADDQRRQTAPDFRYPV